VNVGSSVDCDKSGRPKGKKRKRRASTNREKKRLWLNATHLPLISGGNLSRRGGGGELAPSSWEGGEEDSRRDRLIKSSKEEGAASARKKGGWGLFLTKGVHRIN